MTSVVTSDGPTTTLSTLATSSASSLRVRGRSFRSGGACGNFPRVHTNVRELARHASAPCVKVCAQDAHAHAQCTRHSIPKHATDQSLPPCTYNKHALSMGGLTCQPAQSNPARQSKLAASETTSGSPLSCLSLDMSKSKAPAVRHTPRRILTLWTPTTETCRNIFVPVRGGRRQRNHGDDTDVYMWRTPWGRTSTVADAEACSGRRDTTHHPTTHPHTASPVDKHLGHLRTASHALLSVSASTWRHGPCAALAQTTEKTLNYGKPHVKNYF